MTADVLDIYSNKKALFRSLALNVLGVVWWGGILGYCLYSENISIHPDLSPFIFIPLIGFWGIILLYNFGICVRNILRCAFELPAAPKLIYSVSTSGLIDHRANKKFEWHDFKSLRISASSGDIVLRMAGKSKTLIIEKRGLILEDYGKILTRIPPIAPT